MLLFRSIARAPHKTQFMFAGTIQRAIVAPGVTVTPRGTGISLSSFGGEPAEDPGSDVRIIGVRKSEEERAKRENRGPLESTRTWAPRHEDSATCEWGEACPEGSASGHGTGVQDRPLPPEEVDDGH